MKYFWNLFIIFSAGVTDTLLFFKSFLKKTLFIIQSIPDVLNQVLIYIFCLLITHDHNSSEHAHYACCYSEIKAVVTMWTCDVLLWLTDLI